MGGVRYIAPYGANNELVKRHFSAELVVRPPCFPADKGTKERLGWSIGHPLLLVMIETRSSHTELNQDVKGCG